MGPSRSDDVLPVGKLPSDLLGRLLETYGTPDPTVLVGPGIGGDAAAIAFGDTTLVVKTDPITFVTDSAPQYLVDVNANDLACLGATPRWMMVTALLPEARTTIELVEAQFRELRDACQGRGIALVGGHTEITFGLDRPILIGVLLGEVPSSGLLRPGGARPGDQLLLTKAIAIEGTALLARELAAELGAALDPELIVRAAALLHHPGISVMPDALMLLTGGGITALHDPTEGGLAVGVRELALASGCGATVDGEAVPVLAETAVIAAHLGLDALGMLASGSLLAAASPSEVEALLAVGDSSGIPVARIGELTDRPGEYGMRGADGEGPLPAFSSDEVTRALQAAARG